MQQAPQRLQHSRTVVGKSYGPLSSGLDVGYDALGGQGRPRCMITVPGSAVPTQRARALRIQPPTDVER
jgi:hypothetical protein